MQSTEKIGLALAGLVTLGLLGTLVATRPDVPDPPPPSPTVASAGGPKVQTISRGSAVDLDPYLQPGTDTVVEFMAEW